MIPHTYFYYTFLILLFSISKTTGQRIGLPLINSYPTNATAMGSHTWDIDQDHLGRILFANDDGLVIYDGTSWKEFKFPNGSIARSLQVDNAGRIYVGGQNEFGYYAFDKVGDFKYYDLKVMIPLKDREFDDVWNIEVQNEYVYFRASDKVYILYKNQCNVIRDIGEISFLGRINEDIILQSSKQGVYKVNGVNIEKLEPGNSFYYSPIVATVALNNKVLIVTLTGDWKIYSNGEFKVWRNNSNINNKELQILSAVRTPDNNILIGTQANGLFIYHQDGTLKHHLDKKNGLLNNTVRSVFADNEQNLWIGMDKGINQLLVSSNLSRVFPLKKLDEEGFCSLLFHDKLYFGTTEGLYYTYKEKSKLSYSKESTPIKIEGTDGQVWNLKVLSGHLIMFHHAGMFEVDYYSNKIKKISPKWGYWGCSDLTDSIYLCGSYDGVIECKLNNNKWDFANASDSVFSESSRFAVVENKHTYWVSHPYKGVFKLKKNPLSNQYTHLRYGVEDGLPSELGNYVFDIHDEIIFGTRKGVYKYSEERDSFIIHKSYQELFSEDDPILRLKEDDFGSIWFITKNAVGCHDIEKNGIDQVIKTYYLPELKDILVKGFENINFIDSNNVIFGIQDGFLNLEIQKKLQEDYDFNVVLNEVYNVPTQSRIFSGGYATENGISTKQSEENIHSFSSQHNGFSFNYSATNYDYPEKVLYTCYLEGRDNKWSKWNHIKYKEYTNLDHGEYTFHVKAKNVKGKETSVRTYSFIILPPWYQTTLSYCIYVILILGFIVLWVFYYQSRISVHKEKSKLSEAEIERLEKEKLQLEIDHKNRELLTATMHLSHKNEILSEIETLFGNFRGKVSEKNLKDGIQNVTKLMRIEQQSDLVWKQFENHFNEVHPKFFENLKKGNSSLSQKDLKLCAFIKMNLSTKETASALNMTVRGVEGARYRLRKKLELDGEVKLIDYLYQMVL